MGGHGLSNKVHYGSLPNDTKLTCVGNCLKTGGIPRHVCTHTLVIKVEGYIGRVKGLKVAQYKKGGQVISRSYLWGQIIAVLSRYRSFNGVSKTVTSYIVKLPYWNIKATYTICYSIKLTLGLARYQTFLSVWVVLLDNCCFWHLLTPKVFSLA